MKQRKIKETATIQQNRKMRQITDDSEYDFEKVTNYNYLNVEKHGRAKEENEIQDKINKGNRCVGSLKHVIR